MFFYGHRLILSFQSERGEVAFSGDYLVPSDLPYPVLSGEFEEEMVRGGHGSKSVEGRPPDDRIVC